MMGERRIKTILSRVALREISISERPSFMKSLLCFPEDVLTGVYSIFRFKPLHNFQLDISKLLKKCTLTHLESNVIGIPPWKPVEERAPLSTMRTSISCAMSSILTAMERHSSISEI